MIGKRLKPLTACIAEVSLGRIRTFSQGEIKRMKREGYRSLLILFFRHSYIQLVRNLMPDTTEKKAELYRMQLVLWEHKSVSELKLHLDESRYREAANLFMDWWGSEKESTILKVKYPKACEFDLGRYIRTLIDRDFIDLMETAERLKVDDLRIRFAKEHGLYESVPSVDEYWQALEIKQTGDDTAFSDYLNALRFKLNHWWVHPLIDAPVTGIDKEEEDAPKR